MINGTNNRNLGVDLELLFTDKLAAVESAQVAKAQDLGDVIDQRNALQRALREQVAIARDTSLSPAQRLAKIRANLESSPDLKKLLGDKLPSLTKQETVTQTNVTTERQQIGPFSLDVPVLKTEEKTVTKALSAGEAEKAMEGFIDTIQGISDDFNPMNQKDLSTMQRILTSVNQVETAVSNIMAAHKTVRDNIISALKG